LPTFSASSVLLKLFFLFVHTGLPYDLNLSGLLVLSLFSSPHNNGFSCNYRQHVVGSTLVPMGFLKHVGASKRLVAEQGMS
jgi:hypothetical protein